MIVYFCAEYYLQDNFASYAGGLGILAGDTLRQMGDEGINFAAIGLFYYKGYLQNSDFWQTPAQVGLTQLKNKNGQNLEFKITIADYEVNVCVWTYKYKTATLYLLDCNNGQNTPDLQQISHNLYDTDLNLRLSQELVLGLGGAKLVNLLELNPTVYHLNESHCAFMFLEKKDNAPILFTNHTIVPEGNHMYQVDMVLSKLKSYIGPNGLAAKDLCELGSCPYNGVFSLTSLAIKICNMSNGVSRLHSQKLVQMYGQDAKITYVTNGVHLATWQSLLHKQEGLVFSHAANKLNLINYLNKQFNVTVEPQTLIVTWARRLVEYKRPSAIFKDLQNLHKVLNNKMCNVMLLMSGLPHPKDIYANSILTQIQKLSEGEFNGKLLFIPNYNTTIAKLLVAGSDVWLNTPIVGQEACGTSGMKSALNGVLQLTTKDGWYDEVEIGQIGFELNTQNVAQSFVATMLQKVIPYYVEYKKSTKNSLWYSLMQNAQNLIYAKYNTKVMLQNYLAIYNSLKRV